MTRVWTFTLPVGPSMTPGMIMIMMMMTIHDARPGVWSSPDNILALYKAVQTFISQHSQKQNQNGEHKIENGNILYKYNAFQRQDLLRTGGKIRKLLLKSPNQSRFTFEAIINVS